MDFLKVLLVEREQENNWRKFIVPDLYPMSEIHGWGCDFIGLVGGMSMTRMGVEYGSTCGSTSGWGYFCCHILTVLLLSFESSIGFTALMEWGYGIGNQSLVSCIWSDCF
jgi:hypothetical protein